MIIRIKKQQERNRLICIREDGSIEQENLGPSLPFHDIAHYVVEKHLLLEKGFYGNIAAGYSVQELSDKEVIRTLGPESLISEVATRALQSLRSGACTIEQFAELVESELFVFGLRPAFDLNPKLVKLILKEYMELLSKWNKLKDGEQMEFLFRKKNEGMGQRN